jgi:hypothetical protein
MLGWLLGLLSGPELYSIRDGKITLNLTDKLVHRLLSQMHPFDEAEKAELKTRNSAVKSTEDEVTSRMLALEEEYNDMPLDELVRRVTSLTTDVDSTSQKDMRKYLLGNDPRYRECNAGLKALEREKQAIEKLANPRFRLMRLRHDEVVYSLDQFYSRETGLMTFEGKVAHQHENIFPKLSSSLKACALENIAKELRDTGLKAEIDSPLGYRLMIDDIASLTLILNHQDGEFYLDFFAYRQCPTLSPHSMRDGLIRAQKVFQVLSKNVRGLKRLGYLARDRAVNPTSVSRHRGFDPNEPPVPTPVKAESAPEPETKVETPKASNKEILSPLDTVFLDPDVIDNVALRASIPQLIDGEEPSYSGVILYGPAGTGKTVLLRAIAETYKNAGAITQEFNLAEMTDMWVGILGKNLDRKIQETLDQAKKEGKTAFIFLDEATSLVMTVEGSTSCKRYYQEALDVLKKYIGNYKELVFGISTNEIPENFDSPLIREGRLEPIKIDFPGKKERKDMWRHFLKEYEVLEELTDKQYEELASAVPKEQGAFIEEFCRAYLENKRAQMQRRVQGAATIVAALKSGQMVPMDKVKDTITYEVLLADVQKIAADKYEGSEPKVAGFKPPQ